MKSKRIDVAGFILITFFIVLGLITLYIGIFMPELMDAVVLLRWYSVSVLDQWVS